MSRREMRTESSKSRQSTRRRHQGYLAVMDVAAIRTTSGAGNAGMYVSLFLQNDVLPLEATAKTQLLQGDISGTPLYHYTKKDRELFQENIMVSREISSILRMHIGSHCVPPHTTRT